MHFSFATLLLVASAVSASTINLVARQYPSCAEPCLSKADFGDCSPSDTPCLCKSSAFVASTTTCIQSSCSGDDLENANKVARDLCASVGVTLTSSSSAPDATQTTPAPSGSGSNSGSASGSTSNTGSASNTGSTPSGSPTDSGSQSSPSDGAAVASHANGLSALAIVGLVAAFL